jgi:large subunit ribosomal protein L7A
MIMPLTNLKSAKNRKIGIKQSTRALMEDRAKELFIAKDADQHVIRRIVSLAQEKEIPIVYVDSMGTLGTACGIDVGAATAVIIK